jgi:hypothetical protein
VQDILASESRALIPQLEVAKKEAEASGKIPQELLEKIFAASPRLKQVWQRLEEFMKKNYDEGSLDQCRKAGHLRYIQSFLLEMPETQEARARIVSIGIRKLAIQCVQHYAKRDLSYVLDVAYGWKAIPDQAVVTKLFHYEGAVLKELDRAYDRLERLQRRRKGEPVLPPIRIVTCGVGGAGRGVSQACAGRS